MRAKLVVGALAALLMVAAIPAAAVTSGLGAKVDVAKSFVGRGEPAVVTFTLRNDGDADVYLVAWQTPFQGIQGNLFDVRRDGQPVAYLGPLVKRAAPAPGDYVRLVAGQSRSIRVDLSAAYDFSRSGEYSIRYRVALQDALRDASPVAIVTLAQLASNVAFVAVDRDDAAARFLDKSRRRVTAAAASNSFVRCTSTQQSALVTARGNADTISADAISYLASHTSSSAGARYTTWFGARDSGRYATVQGHYNSIDPVFKNAAITFDCKCKQKNTYAFVYPDRPYEIHLCGAFWTAPAMGTDSKAGTLVHETSHFTVVAGTDDWAYGQSACKSLALSDPVKAVDNADTHEYFAENTPAQN
jgi:peptidyl-Lys metalloendopeptidase